MSTLQQNTKMRAFLIFTTVLFLTTANVQALKCYTCSTSETDVDQRCVNNPEQGDTLNCNKNYCTTVRIEYVEPKGKIQSIQRTCLDKPVFLNEVIEDFTFRSYYTSCQTDLCNGGSGKDTSQGGLVGDIGDAIMLFVPGIGVNSALITSCLTLLLGGAALLVHFFR